MGKIITNYKNVGVALVDLTKLDQQDYNSYSLDGKKVVLW